MHGSLWPMCNEWRNCKTLCRMFKDRWISVHNEEWSGCPAICSEWRMILFKVSAKIFVKHGTSQFRSELSSEFPQVSCTFLYIITVRLSYHKFYARWFPTMLTGVHKLQRMAVALTFLEQYHKDGGKSLNHIIWLTGDWASFVNADTKEQSKQWMHTQWPNKTKKFKQTLSAWQKTDSNCFLGQERNADDGIHATRGHNKDRSVLQNTNENCVVPFRTHGVECWHPVLLHDMHISIWVQQLALENRWSILTGSCLTILLRALISLRVTATCLPPRRTGLHHRYSTIMSSWSHRQQDYFDTD